MPRVEVDDAAAAFRKLEDATRRIMAAPKKNVDAAMTRMRAAGKKRHRKG
jgi:hypothetical protein